MVLQSYALITQYAIHAVHNMYVPLHSCARLCCCPAAAAAAAVAPTAPAATRCYRPYTRPQPAPWQAQQTPALLPRLLLLLPRAPHGQCHHQPLPLLPVQPPLLPLLLPVQSFRPRSRPACHHEAHSRWVYGLVGRLVVWLLVGWCRDIVLVDRLLAVCLSFTQF